MFLFVILFLSLWAVAASIVVDRTDQCGSDMLPCRNHMCCLGYNGIVALLSGCSLVRYCSHEFIFPNITIILEVFRTKTISTIVK